MVKNLLKKLIEIPSVSGEEQKIAKFVFDYLKNNGLKPKLLSGNNLYCEFGKGNKTLLLNSHLDTVPPSSSWTINPFKTKEKNGKIYGLGAADTKSSLAAMTEAIIYLKNSKKIPKGKIIFTATTEEEVGMKGMEKLVKKLPKFDAAIIGEPTSLNICIAQKGALCLKFIAKSKGGHAALGGENAIYKGIEDIKLLQKLKFKKRHSLLNRPSIQITIMNAGHKINVIPSKCEFLADIRSTPVYSNNYLINLIRKRVKSDVEILSNRLFPKETNVNEEIVQVAKSVNKFAKITGFPAMSEFNFINKPGIILGPGDFNQAHIADEFVRISQLEKATEIYQKIIENFLE